MMYGAGDVESPLPETTALVEQLAVEFITGTVSNFVEKKNCSIENRTFVDVSFSGFYPFACFVFSFLIHFFLISFLISILFIYFLKQLV